MTDTTTLDTPDVFDDADLDGIELLAGVLDGQTANGGDLGMRLEQHDLYALLATAEKPVSEAQIKAGILKAYPGRHWDQLCQAFARDVCALFGHAPAGYGSANAARTSSRIASSNPASAPAASFHYWRIGAFGHVMVGLGGSRVAGATKYLDTFWGTKAQAIGTTTVGRYTARTGASYVGWSLTNGANDFTMAKLSNAAAERRDDVRRLAKHLNGLNLGKHTTAADDGDPGEVYYWLVQTEGHRDGTYPKSSPADGKVGPLTRKSEAAQLKALK